MKHSNMFNGNSIAFSGLIKAEQDGKIRDITFNDDGSVSFCLVAPMSFFVGRYRIDNPAKPGESTEEQNGQ